MTKQEFKALTKRDFTDKEYETIETVYTFHPAIEPQHSRNKGGIRRDRKARSQKGG